MKKLSRQVAIVALAAVTLAAAALASPASVVTLHPGQSKKIGRVVVMCTTHTVRTTATRIVLHPGRQVRVGKTTVKCVAAPKPKPPPPPPPPTTTTTTTAPPVTPVTPGSYKGATQDGNFVFFTVTADRRMTSWRANDLTEQCNEGYYIPGAISLGTESFIQIGDDGHFDYLADGTATFGGSPDTYHFEIAGTMSGTSVSGTVVLTDSFDYNGLHLNCASPVTNWTATLQP
jgi:hypothetical protein